MLPLAMLAVAGRLSPSPSGLGTHQQLGFPPCTLRVLAGIECPVCGMTTSWSHFARGEWGQSLSTHPGGFLLALYAVAWSMIATRVAFSGKLPGLATQRRMGISLIAIAVVVLTRWGGYMIGGPISF